MSRSNTTLVADDVGMLCLVSLRNNDLIPIGLTINAAIAALVLVKAHPCLNGRIRKDGQPMSWQIVDGKLDVRIGSDKAHLYESGVTALRVHQAVLIV